MQLTWKLQSFDSLSPRELYDILRLRTEVFVVEQNCAYQELDGKDSKSMHLSGCSPEGKLMVYARILPPGVSYAEASIGRVVSSQEVRRNGAGRALLSKAIEELQKIHGNVPIRIGAQRYLEEFYSSFGFTAEGEEYIEDGIPHILMFRKAD